MAAPVQQGNQAAAGQGNNHWIPSWMPGPAQRAVVSRIAFNSTKIAISVFSAMYFTSTLRDECPKMWSGEYSTDTVAKLCAYSSGIYFACQVAHNSVKALLRELPYIIVPFTLPMHQRENFIRQAGELITSEMGFIERISLLNLMRNDVPADQREDVFRRTQGFVTHGMNGAAIERFIDAISDVPLEDRDSFSEEIHNVPADQRNAVLFFVEVISAGNMDVDEKKALIRELRNTPADQRFALAMQVRRVSTGEMDGFDKANLLFMLREVPEEHRDGIIHRIRAIPAEQRAGEVRTTADRFFADRTSRRARDEISLRAAIDVSYQIEPPIETDRPETPPPIYQELP